MLTCKGRSFRAWEPAFIAHVSASQVEGLAV